MRWAWLAIFAILIAAVFSCQKQFSTEENAAFQIGDVSTSALIDSLVVADSLDTSGIDYIDGIYDLSLATDSATKAYPVYHSLVTTDLPCQASDSLQSSCIFDETDVDGDGTPDINGANKNKLKVDPKTGVIDLAATVEGGAFGPTPENGSRRAFTFFYRLDDHSKRMLEAVTIRMIYYKQRSDVPLWLVNAVAVRKQQYLVSTSSSPTSSLTAFATLYKPKRPPLIVIVSGY